jgi:aconitate hydratase
MMKTARMLKGKTVAPHVSLVVSPGSKQVLTMLAQNGALADILDAGARILESGCGPCIGMGQSPATNGVSLRTFNRNFKGRCGTDSAEVYLVSTETAVASAIAGCLTDPTRLEADIHVDMPGQFWVNDNMVVPPSKDPRSVEVVRGPNIKSFPLNTKLPSQLRGEVLLKLGDNVTTDQIMPSNARLLPYRSNIPYLAEYCLAPCDETFPARAKKAGGGVVAGGENYGQGSSREHAALAPLYLGIKAVLVKSFARIHKSNLINSGILPLTFKNSADYDALAQGDTLIIPDAGEQVRSGADTILVRTESGRAFEMALTVTDQERKILLAGGKINQIREEG